MKQESSGTPEEAKPASPAEAYWRAPVAPAAVPPEWQLEARLTAALRGLPEVPVAGNFTARVLAEVDRTEAAAQRSPRWSWGWFRPQGASHGVPRFAVLAVVLVVTGLGLRQYQIQDSRARLARTVATVADAGPAPSMEALENLDAIQRLGRAAQADNELLAALQ